MIRIKVALFTTVPIVHYGLRALLSHTAEDLELIEAGKSINSFQEALAVQNPAVALLDLESGVPIETCLVLLTQFPSTQFVLWTREAAPDVAARAIDAGMRGILLKTLGNDLLLKCLRKVAAGESWFGKALTQSIIARRPISLSSRERQLVGALHVGLSNKEIAACLNVAEGSVKVYLSRLYRKLGVRDRLELVLFSMRHQSLFVQEVEQLRARRRSLGLVEREQDNIGLSAHIAG